MKERLWSDVSFAKHFPSIFFRAEGTFNKRKKLIFTKPCFSSHCSNKATPYLLFAVAYSGTYLSFFSVAIKPIHHMMFGVFANKALRC